MQPNLRLIILIAFLFPVTRILPQDDIDSIISAWNHLARKYLEISAIDSACKYGNCSVELLESHINSADSRHETGEVRKLKFQKAEALSYLTTAYGASGNLELAELSFHEARQIYQDFQDAQHLYQLNIRMGRALDMTNRYKKANLFYEEACRQALITGNLREQALCYYFIGLNNRYMGNFSEALKYHLMDLEIQQELGNKRGIGNAYITVAAILNTLKDRPAALEKLSMAKKLFEEIGDTSGIATVYNDLGSTYLVMGDTMKALQNHIKSSELRFKIKDYDGIGASNSYIGEIYLNRGEPVIALKYLKQSEKAFRKNGNLDGVMHTFLKISSVYVQRKELDSALYFLDLAELEAGEIMSTLGFVRIYSARGEIWLKEKKFQSAIDDFSRALAIARDQNNFQQMYLLNRHLADTYYKTGNYKTAYEYLQVSARYSDSVEANANLKAAIQMDMEYNYQQEKLETKLNQEKKDALNIALLKNQKTQKTLFFAGVVMFLMVSLGLWSRLRFIRRAGKELLERKEEAEYQRMVAETERARATKSEQVKEQFLANMSHEIRTPMNAIKGITEILIRNEYLPEQQKYLEAIRQSSENLLVILNEILDLSKLEAGKMEPENIPFDPVKVLQNVQDILRYKAEEKGLKLVLNADPAIPSMICGDPTHLSQIILNLASNAVKFTDKGTVSMDASVKQITGETVALRFIISDTGIGIPQDKIDQIFEVFSQADTDTTRKYGGTGLGLTICKRLVELHQGTIAVESEPGKGSTFTVEMPFQQSTIGKPEIVEGFQKELTDIKVLLAEDNEFNVMVALDVLESAVPGVKVDVAGNGEAAVSMVEENDYDLILMDIQMPEMDGYDATKSIRKMNGTKGGIPIIAMTANVLKAEVDRCFEAGMNGYIAKPFERSELMQQIKNTLANA